MQRQSILATLPLYQQLWLTGTDHHASFDAGEEMQALGVFKAFVRGHADCFERSCAPGHVTGSALVVSPDLNEVLLTLHGKLGLWLQLGGHADGEPFPDEVARREALEESGLSQVAFLPYEASLARARSAQAPQLAPLTRPLPFDFDHHLIPARRDEPAHIHYDVRYILVADRQEALQITAESKDLRWFPCAEARRVADERSMQRQFDKLDWLRARLGR